MAGNNLGLKISDTFRLHLKALHLKHRFEVA